MTEDFEWNETAGQARIHVSLAGQTIAIRTVTWSPPTGGGCAAAPGALPRPGGGTGKGVFEWLYPCAGALAVLMALRALQRRRRGEPVVIALGWRPGIAAATGIAFVAVFVVPEALRVQQAEAFVAGEIVFFHGDHLGSAVVTTNGAGALIERVLYRPYGSRIPASGQTNAPEVGFTGQRFEAATQLYDYGARFYDPAMGRFLQPDPIVSDVYTPQTMNAYAYALGSPVNFVDPTGMSYTPPPWSAGNVAMPDLSAVLADGYSSLFDSIDAMLGQMLWPAIGQGVVQPAMNENWATDAGYGGGGSSKGGYAAWRGAIGNFESGGVLGIRNGLGYVGLFQFGEALLVDVGYYKGDSTGGAYQDFSGPFTGRDGITTLDEFRRSEPAQLDAFDRAVPMFWDRLTGLQLDRFVGSTVNGVIITESGLIGGTWIGGQGGVRQYLTGGGNPADGNGTTVGNYISRFGGYDIGDQLRRR